MMSTDNQAYSVAMIGLGWVTREIWLPAFLANPSFQVIGGYDVHACAVSLTHSKFPSFPFFDSLDAILAARPDLVLIATPNVYHVDYAVYFLENHISVMLEKPLCLTLEAYSRLARAERNSRATVIPSAASKLRDDVLALCDRLSAAEFGAVRALSLAWVRCSGIPNPGSWFTHQKMAGGGVGFDLGWHLLDVGLSLIGYPDIVAALSVSQAHFLKNAMQNSARWRDDAEQKAPLSSDVEDQFFGLMQSENGVAVQLHAAWASHESQDVTRIVVQCDRATLELKTTFGMSANRIPVPALVIKSRGEVLVTSFPDSVVGAEYQRQVDVVADTLQNKALSRLHMKQIRSIVQSLEMMYATCRTKAAAVV